MFKGLVDSSLAAFGPSEPEKTKWCFYIPGSPYFWQVDQVKLGDTLFVGDLPAGKYPLRLIRIKAQDAKHRMNLLEVYSMNMKPLSTFSRSYVAGVGDLLFSYEVPISLMIRPEAK